MNEITDRLFSAALAARANAYAPHSRFAVGAAILTPGGRVFSGCNVENASYPVGTCAETGAVAAMAAAGERRISAVLVLADMSGPNGRPITPCGACRQRLAEFGAADTLVHAAGPEGIRATFSLGSLLPEAFAL